ncbi:tetratricopeptide repeat protein [Zavarzinella formosa]|uniref:tetratricopeptide repeat protein n=1 Tax=Zavarzinella formosa TaxID=360055 RepID=UPI0002EDA3DE|nr:tetratricopeptide repeat protein [Zavarzinella formosa]
MNRSMLMVMIAGLLALVAVFTVRNFRRDPATKQDAAGAVEDFGRDEIEARESLRIHPEDCRARLKLATSLRRQGKISEAEAELIRAIQDKLPQEEGRREVVLQMAPKDWPEKMEGMFQQVVREHPDDREVLAAVAASYSAKGRWENAEPLYSRLVVVEPDRAEWRFQRGVARMRTAYFVNAVEDFREVLKGDSSNYQARLFLGHSLLGDARMSDAERELETCRQQRPEATEPLVGLADCAMERNDLTAAESLLNQAAKLDNKSAQVFQELAKLYLRQQRTPEAITALRRLLALDPNHRQGHLQLSQALLAIGNKTEASQHEAIYQELDRKEEERLNSKRGVR